MYSDDFEDLESGDESDIEDNDIQNGDVIIQRIRDPNPQLPETVTVLEGEYGSKVYLVGTAHFSEDSQQDVCQVSRKVPLVEVIMKMMKIYKNLIPESKRFIFNMGSQENPNRFQGR